MVLRFKDIFSVDTNLLLMHAKNAFYGMMYVCSSVSQVPSKKRRHNPHIQRFFCFTFNVPKAPESVGNALDRVLFVFLLKHYLQNILCNNTKSSCFFVLQVI